MKARYLLVFAGLWTLGALAVVADRDSVVEPPLAAVSSPGCLNQSNEAGVEAGSIGLESDLFGPAPLSLVKGTCGPCSLSPCAGRSVGSPCGIINGEYTWCIPPLTTKCSGGGSNDWDCWCASHYY